MRIITLWFVACAGDKTTPSDTSEPVDADGDGFGPDLDCDDSDSAIHPDAAEICGSVDEDCDGLIDAEDDSLQDGVIVYQDSDGDGHGDPEVSSVTCDAEGQATEGDDCDDTQAGRAPGLEEVCDDGVDQDCSGEDLLCPVLPVAPAPGSFMAQGLQTAFVRGEVPCTGSLSLGLSDQALCYVDEGELFCGGRIFTELYGSSFVSTGLVGVSQVLLMPTVNIENGNGACAIVDGVPTCLAYWNFSGQLGTGGTDSSAVWTPWLEGEGLQWLATGTSDSFCGPAASGDVWCTGYGFGETPLLSGETANASVWVDTFGQLQLDHPDVFRVSQGRAECQIESAGLVCRSGLGPSTWGTAGHVVDGGYLASVDFSEENVVWLEDDGRAWRGRTDASGAVQVQPLFLDQAVWALAYHSYTDTVCGVYADGSLVCLGSNAQGKLGTGSDAPLLVETEVLPAGTFEVQCP